MLEPDAPPIDNELLTSLARINNDDNNDNKNDNNNEIVLSLGKNVIITNKSSSLETISTALSAPK